MVSKLAEFCKLRRAEYSESFIQNSVHYGQDPMEVHEVLNTEIPMCCTGPNVHIYDPHNPVGTRCTDR